MIRLIYVIFYMIFWIIYSSIRFILTFKYTKLNRFSAWAEQEDFSYEYEGGKGYATSSHKTPFHYIFNIKHTETAEREQNERDTVRAEERAKWDKKKPTGYARR